MSKRKAILATCLSIAVGVLILGGWLIYHYGFETNKLLQREYREDIIVELQNDSAAIVIKEWSYLQGSGAEVYYKYRDSKPFLIGETIGGDDGFCPFEQGLYEIVQDGDSVCIKWCFNPYKDVWRTQTFELPIHGDGSLVSVN